MLSLSLYCQPSSTLFRYCRPYQGTANIIEILLSLLLNCQPSSDTANLIKVANLIEILLSLSLYGQLGSDTGSLIQTLPTLSRLFKPNTVNLIEKLPTSSRYCQLYPYTLMRTNQLFRICRAKTNFDIFRWD